MREERERIGLSQGAFGELGGVKANAQGNYEKGERYPDAAYLAAVAERGVDVLYVVTGRRVPVDTSSLSADEAEVVKLFRNLAEDDRESVRRMTHALSTTRGLIK